MSPAIVWPHFPTDPANGCPVYAVALAGGLQQGRDPFGAKRWHLLLQRRRTSGLYSRRPFDLDHSMFVRFALLGDAVVVTGGKWNLLGNFNLVWAKSFPTRCPPMGILLRIEADYREIGRHTLKLDFVNETGERLSGPDPLEFELGQPRAPGFPVEFVVGIQINNLQIPARCLL